MQYQQPGLFLERCAKRNVHLKKQGTGGASVLTLDWKAILGSFVKTFGSTNICAWLDAGLCPRQRDPLEHAVEDKA